MIAVSFLVRDALTRTQCQSLSTGQVFDIRAMFDGKRERKEHICYVWVAAAQEVE